jgi:hypothetical protein
MAFQQATTAARESRNRALFHAGEPSAAAWRQADPASERPTGRRRAAGLGLLPALILSVLAFFAVSALETFSINPDRPAAILFPEALSKDQAFAAIVAAGGLPIRPARSALSDGIVWIAAAGSPDFFDRVKSHGAWAVINPFAFGGCFLVKPV